jgi:hypothetical protein
MRWKDVLDRVGEDAVATMVYLYFDELARELGRRADDYDDAKLIFKELEAISGVLIDSYLEENEIYAWERFQREYGSRLDEPAVHKVHEVIYSLI